MQPKIGHGPDAVINDIYNWLILDSFESAGRDAEERFKRLGGRYLPGTLGPSHIAPLALDLLCEAEMAYCFNLRRSSIFCCASALDSELRRYLVDEHSYNSKELDGKTFGWSIDQLKKKAGTLKNSEIENLMMVNNIRNKLAVHGASGDMLISARDTYGKDDDGKAKIEELEIIIGILLKYCSSEEIEKLQKRGDHFLYEATDLLALKVLVVTKTTILTLGK